MSLEEHGMHPADKEHANFVSAVIARSIEEAKQYSELLGDHDIPAIVGDDEKAPDEDDSGRETHSRSMANGVPVLVPEAMLDEASEVIADREDLDEFRVGEEELEEEDNDELGLKEEITDDLAGSPDEEGLQLDEDDEDEEDFEDDEDEEF